LPDDVNPECVGGEQWMLGALISPNTQTFVAELYRIINDWKKQYFNNKRLLVKRIATKERNKSSNKRVMELIR